ncbi:hypothetical protein BGZ96_006401 [Linnemannia gamsii]|uniref:F-box domain-containing protein n=1 Tax=Linnemannia gamsii TaxID=64522 RepID=A0ABQ7KFB7_9FUNG|nr:hypothetical protein BGZ96_006401 [Linnemannia gamsii]
MSSNAATTTTTTPAATSIFDLPPVLDLICKYIWTDDISTCRLVCKDWALHFEIYRWRNIEVDTPSLDHGTNGEEFCASPGPSSLQAVRKNSVRIWTLAIEAQVLVQLLSVEHNQAQGQDQAQNQQCSDDGDNINYQDILSTPRILLRKRLTNKSRVRLYASLKICDSPTLTVLDIDSHRTADQRLVLAILKNCPPSLRRLTLGCLCQGRDKAEITQNSTATVRDSDMLYDWRHFETLTSLSVDCQWGECESWVHHPILRNSPNLRYLKTGCYVDVGDEDQEDSNTAIAIAGYRQTLEIALTACSLIEHFHIQHGGQAPVVSASELVRLIQAYPKGLKSLNFEIPTSGIEEVIAALLKTSVSTLESLSMEYYSGMPPLPKATISRIVEDCPLLEVFDMNCQCHAYSLPDCLYVEPQAFVDAECSLYDAQVLDSIRQHLFGKDIHNCRLVCKVWASLFDIYRWKSIHYNPPSNNHGPSPQTIRRNSPRTQYLNICLSQLSNLLEQQEQEYNQSTTTTSTNEAAAFHQLQEGIFANVSNLCCRGGDDGLDENDPEPANRLFKFLTTTTMRLRSFMLPRLMANSSQGFDFSVLSSFAAHPALTELTLSGEIADSDPVLTLAILKNCPPSLQRLTMCCFCQGDDHAARTLSAAAYVAKSEKSYQWKHFESLKSLSVGCDYGGVGGCETWVHIPIVKSSPKLKVFSLFAFHPRDETGLITFRELLETVITYSPNITRLRVDAGNNPLPVTDLVHLIRSYPKGLEFLIIAMPRTGQDQILSAILETSRSTLESLYIDFWSSTPLALSEDNIHHFVQECSRLKELETECRCDNDLPEYNPDDPEPCVHYTFQTFIQAQGLEPIRPFNIY